MLKERTYRISLGALLLFAACIWMLMSLPGCHGAKQLRTTVRDSVATTVHTYYKDTTIYTPADSARTTLGTDWTAMHKLMAELSQRPRVVHGTKQASVVISKVDSTHFQVEAKCEAMALAFDSLVQVQQRTTYQLQRIQEQVAVRDHEDRFRMPGWAKGVAMVAGSACALLVLTALLPTIKQLFNGKA